MNLLKKKEKKKEQSNVADTKATEQTLVKRPISYIKIADGPATGERILEKFVKQDVLIIPCPQRVILRTDDYEGSGRENLGPTGECFAIYRRRPHNDAYYFEGYLTSDYLRRHKDYDKEAPLKVD